MHVVSPRYEKRRSVRSLVAVMAVAVLAASCSSRSGVAPGGSLPPPDGTQDAVAFVYGLTTARKAMKLPALVRDPALDGVAKRALQVIEAGVPDGIGALEHVTRVLPLPSGLEYGIGFEDLTRGIDDRTRRTAEVESGAPVSRRTLAEDPALDGFGWAAGGPWSVFVLRARPLVPTDAAALQAEVSGAVGRARPGLRPDPGLTAIAADAVADGTFGPDDQGRLGRAGGVPVHLSHSWSGASLPSLQLDGELSSEGPGTLRDPWLDRVGVAATVTGSGTVVVLVLATGDTDRAALAAQVAEAEPKATELVNRARQTAGVPPVRLDPSLVASAKLLAEESARRGCLVAMDDPGCPGPGPPGADEWYSRQYTWVSGEAAYAWDLSPTRAGDERLTHFGAAAVLGPDGTVWSTLVFSS